MNSAKKIVLAVVTVAIAAIAVIAVLLMGLLPTLSPVEVKGWEVKTEPYAGGKAVFLYFNYVSKGAYEAKLIGPDGTEIGSTAIDAATTRSRVVMSSYMTLRGYGEIPPPGEYKLCFVDKDGRIVYEKKIVFSGANLSLKDVKLKYEILFGLCIHNVTIELENRGDLPAYVHKVTVEEEKTGTEYFEGYVGKGIFLLGEYIDPGMAKVLTIEGLAPNSISSGEHTFVIKLLDYNEKVILTKTISFNGAALSIKDVKLEFKTEKYFGEMRTYISKAIIEVENKGDFPGFVYAVEINEEKTGTKYFKGNAGKGLLFRGEYIDPGMAKVLTIEGLAPNSISSGEHTFVIKLLDYNEEVIASKTITVNV